MKATIRNRIPFTWYHNGFEFVVTGMDQYRESTPRRYYFDNKQDAIAYCIKEQKKAIVYYNKKFKHGE